MTKRLQVGSHYRPVFDNDALGGLRLWIDIPEEGPVQFRVAGDLTLDGPHEVLHETEISYEYALQLLTLPEERADAAVL